MKTLAHHYPPFVSLIIQPAAYSYMGTYIEAGLVRIKLGVGRGIGAEKGVKDTLINHLEGRVP